MEKYQKQEYGRDKMKVKDVWKVRKDIDDEIDFLEADIQFAKDMVKEKEAKLKELKAERKKLKYIK